MVELNTYYKESALETMPRIPDGFINLIMTSPPYGQARENTYGGIDPDKFIEWFKPFAIEFKRILAKDGSLIINLGDVTVDGETELFPFELPIMMKRELGFSFIDPFIWHKKTCPPGKYPNRLKDAWEFCFHFSLQKDIKFRSDNVLQPANIESVKRALRHKSEHFKESQTGSGFNSTQANALRRIRGTGSNFKSADADLEARIMALPSNVLHYAPEGINRKHPAVYPVSIPVFFIQLLTDPGDKVYDPFFGSGTTGEAALRLDRHIIGSEIFKDYWPDIDKRLYPFLVDTLFKQKQ